MFYLPVVEHYIHILNDISVTTTYKNIVEYRWMSSAYKRGEILIRLLSISVKGKQEI